jgi:putative oxidoreductase
VSFAEIAEIVGRALIAYLFVWTGIYNWSRPERVRFNIEHLRGRGVPYPSFVLHAAFVWQIVAGLAVLFGLYLKPAIVMLLIFTVLAEILFHNYWNMKDPLRRMYHRLLFLNNCGVMGGLILFYLHVA